LGGWFVGSCIQHGPHSKLLNTGGQESDDVFLVFQGLTELPFQLLLDGDGKYLFEKFVLSTTPSLRTIKYLSERLCTLQRYSLVDQEAVLVVGDAAFNLEEERLSESRKEVRLISSIFEGKVLELLGRRASVQNVLDWGRRPSASSNQQEFCQAFMHIATHGQVNETYKKGALQLAHPKAPEWEDSDEGYSDEDSGQILSSHFAIHLCMELSLVLMALTHT
jgi:CHAT domain-containing protein